MHVPKTCQYEPTEETDSQDNSVVGNNAFIFVQKISQGVEYEIICNILKSEYPYIKDNHAENQEKYYA